MNYLKPIIISRTLPYLGGREIIVQTIIEYFSKVNGVTVITPDNLSDLTGCNLIKYLKIEEDNIILKLKEGNYQVVNCHTFYLADFAIRVAQELGLPLVFTLHGVFVKFYDLDYSKLLLRIYAQSESVITVSQNYLETLNQLFKDRTKLKYITNGVPKSLEVKKISSLTQLMCTKREKNSKYLVVVPARLTQLKGLDYLVESTKYLDSSIKIIICSPKHRKNIEEDFYKNKLKDRLQFLNKTELVDFLEFDNSQIFSIFDEANLVLLPSLIEGVSISILEAMALGCVVAATNVGGNCEIINHLVNGYLFNPKDEIVIANVIKEIKETNKVKLDEIKSNAKEKIATAYSLDRMFFNYHQHFEEISINYITKNALSVI